MVVLCSLTCTASLVTFDERREGRAAAAAAAPEAADRAAAGEHFTHVRQMHIQVHSVERTCLREQTRCGGDALLARRCCCSASACRRPPLCCLSRLSSMRMCVAQKQADKQQQYQFKPAQPWRITTWSTCRRTAVHRPQPVQVSRKRAGAVGCVREQLHMLSNRCSSSR